MNFLIRKPIHTPREFSAKSSMSKTPSLVRYCRASTMIKADKKSTISFLKLKYFAFSQPKNPKGMNMMIFPKRLMTMLSQEVVFWTKRIVETSGKSLTIFASCCSLPNPRNIRYSRKIV